MPLLIRSVDYQRYICVLHSTCLSCCRCSVSARGIMEGLPWAHWKGSWQDDKASISLQLSSKVKCSLNLIAPEKKIQILAGTAKEDANLPAAFPPHCALHRKQGSSQRWPVRLQYGLAKLTSLLRKPACYGLNFHITQVWWMVRFSFVFNCVCYG